MNKDAISIIQQQADTDDKKQKILIVDDSKFNTFGCGIHDIDAAVLVVSCNHQNRHGI